MSFTSLPVEVFLKIFSYLDLHGITTVRALNTFHRDVVETSSLLQYVAALDASGLQDENAPLTVQQKLEYLTAYERAWRGLSSEDRTRLVIKHSPSNIYDLSGGVYILGDSNQRPLSRVTRSLRYVDLAEATIRRGEGPRLISEPWSQFNIDVRIVDMGLALQEHDLIAVITRLGVDNRSQRLRLELKQFSTGQNHPNAAHPVIDVDGQVTLWAAVSVMIEIAGPLLLLLLTEPLQPAVRDRLLLFNWMTGNLIVRETAPNRTWSGFIFLSPDSALVPNLAAGTLEIFHLAHSESELHDGSTLPRREFARIRGLGLPARRDWCSFVSISCRADPNPYGRPESYVQAIQGGKSNLKIQGRPAPPRVFSARPERAVVLFECYMGPRHRELERSFFTFIAHRSTILRVAYMHNCGATWDYDDDLVIGQVGQSDVDVVPWEEWGPENTRWMDTDDIDRPRWITTTAGQRQALMRDFTFFVRDYNPREVRRVQKMIEDEMDGSEDYQVVTESTMTDSGGCFVDDIESSLAYAEFPLKGSRGEGFLYDDVMVDEERVIGLGINEVTDVVEFIDIFPYNTPIAATAESISEE